MSETATETGPVSALDALAARAAAPADLDTAQQAEAAELLGLAPAGGKRRARERRPGGGAKGAEVVREIRERAGRTPSAARTAARASAAARDSAARSQDAAGPVELTDEQREARAALEAEQARRREMFAPITTVAGKVYRPRPLGVDMTDVEMLRRARANGQHVLLEGPPGCGKTAVAHAAFGDELLTIGGQNDVDESSLTGSHRQDPQTGRYEFHEGALVRAMREGRPLVIDDVTLIDPGVAGKLYPAMEIPYTITVEVNQHERVTAQPGFVVVASHNPDAPGAMLSEALASRFHIHVPYTTDYKLARELGVPGKAVDAAVALDARYQKGELPWAPQMRELIAFRDVAAAFGEAFAASNLINKAPMEVRDDVAAEVAVHFTDLVSLGSAVTAVAVP